MDIPQVFHGFKLEFLADVRCGPHYFVERTREVFDLVNILEPDLILSGGDYVYGSGAVPSGFSRALKWFF